MKTRFALSTFLLLVCVCAYGQQVKTTSTSKQTVDELTLKISEQQELIRTLEEENITTKQQFEKLEKDIQLYREDVRTTVENVHNYVSEWFSFLSIVVAILTGIFGVASPLFINRNTQKAQDKYNGYIIEKLRAQTKQSEDALSKLKEDIQEIQKQIDISKNDALKAANEAKASELFSQALNEKDPQKAIQLFTNCIEHFPYATAYYNRAIIKQSINDLYGAIDDYSKAIQLNPNFADAYNNRGTANKRAGNYVAALDDYNKVIELNPNDSEAYDNRGILKKDMKDNLGAMEDYNKAIELNPNNALAYNNRADLNIVINDLFNAINDINKSIELNNKLSVTHITRGEINMLLTNYDVAIDDFTTALSLRDGITNELKKQALIKRAECYDKLAGTTMNEQEKSSYIDKAKIDRKEADNI